MKHCIEEQYSSIDMENVPCGYKKTKLGMFPIDWNDIPLRELLKIVERPIKMEDTSEYELITVRRNFGGIDSRGKFFGKDVLVKSQFVLKKNDFVISRRQISHGACGVVPDILDGAIVSNEYDIFNPTSELDIKYFSYLVQLPSIKNLFYIYSNGVHIEKMIFATKDWLKQKVCIPNLNEQKYIVSILATWDNAIELKEELIEQKKRQKRSLVQKLLINQNGLPGFGGECIEVNFDECFRKLPSKHNQINTSEYLNKGKYPIVDQGQNKIVGYCNDDSRVYKCPKEGVIVFGDHTRVIKFIDFDFVIGADGTHILQNKHGFDISFLYYQLCSKDIPNLGYSRHFKLIKEMTFVIPALEVQKKIAGILSLLDQEISLLDNELNSIRQQRKGLMQLLLRGKVRVSVRTEVNKWQV